MAADAEFLPPGLTRKTHVRVTARVYQPNIGEIRTKDGKRIAVHRGHDLKTFKALITSQKRAAAGRWYSGATGGKP